ncbi:phosphatase PAP2 family protein [Prevotella cerevisiae]|uniref:Phosphatase PAP2 family protein n=1 Tax=Segatella cerevisiae TaxID=2053716 RepID=A0ABT1BYD6_9BACT|nr:phosphatase PAP2 family protein [Segatella cerevisiae]MCO6026100.1 phosphatase PAP2 family protein [Segatella cerevisiae]
MVIDLKYIKRQLTGNRQFYRVLFSLFLFLLFCIPLPGKEKEADTLQDRDTLRHQGFIDHFSQTHLFQSTYLGVPLIIGGLIEKHQDTKFRELRNDFMPKFHRTLDNYTQFAPAAVLLGMKACGIESRSSWGRMLVSDAFSTALMAGTVQGLKHSIKVTRPDGSDHQSFPSGHTATAFMTATMLSKEYGYLSPWVSVGAYSAATVTGLMRMANNKHWLSDVMVGAGIGILSTEMGYWLADLLCKNKGLDIPEQPWESPLYFQQKPSFIGLYMGFNMPLSKYDLDKEHSLKTSTGTTIGLEGAWFWNPYMGIGGRGSISNLQYILNDKTAPESTFDFYSVGIGPYFSYPLTVRWKISSKLLIGEVKYLKNNISGVYTGKQEGLMAGTGADIDYQIRTHLAGSLFLDYTLQAPASKYSGEYLHLLTLGARISFRF